MNRISKAVILARGLGKRMRRMDSSVEIDPSQSTIADSGVKAMIPFGRPFLDYSLSTLADADFTEACLVIGPEHDGVRDYYRQLRSQRMTIGFAVQEEPHGTADAVAAAQSFVGDDEFLVLNSDNYYPAEVLAEFQEMTGPGAVMFDSEALVANSNIPADRVRQFAYAAVDENSYLTDIIEKPAEELKNDDHRLVSMNCWRFSPDIFGYCQSVPLSSRGEYELPQAVRYALRAGMRLRVVRSIGGVLDLSNRSDIAAVADRLRHVTVNL